MTPEEFFALVEEDNYEYKNLRYHSIILRRTPEYNRLKGHEEAAKYIMELLNGVNFKSTNYISPKDEDKRRSCLTKAAEDVKRKIGRLRQTQSQEREKYFIMADALEEYYKQLVVLPLTDFEEADAYIKKQQKARLEDVVEAVKIVEHNLNLATMGMTALRQTLEELQLLKEHFGDEEDD